MTGGTAGWIGRTLDTRLPSLLTATPGLSGAARRMPVAARDHARDGKARGMPE